MWLQRHEETIVATRKFARRQLTWFRADPRITWLDWQDPRLVAKAAPSAASRAGLTYLAGPAWKVSSLARVD